MKNYQVYKTLFCLLLSVLGVIGKIEYVEALRLYRTPISYVEFSKDGKQIAAAYGHQVAIWEVDSELNVKQLNVLHHPAEVNYLGFSPTGNLLVTCGNLGDGTGQGIITFWSQNFAKEYELLSSSSVYTLGFSRNGKFLATGNSEGNIEIIAVSADKTEKILTVNSFSDPVYSVAFSPDEKYFAAGSRDSIKIWTWPLQKDSQPLRTIEIRDGLTSVQFLKFAPDSQYVYATTQSIISSGAYSPTSSKPMLRLPNLFDIAEGRVGSERLENHPATEMENYRIWSLDISVDGQHLAIGYSNGRIRLFKIENSQFHFLEVKLGHHVPSSQLPVNDVNWWWPSTVCALSFSPNYKLFVSGSFDGEVSLWKLGESLTDVPRVRYLRNVSRSIPLHADNWSQADLNHLMELVNKNRMGKWMQVDYIPPQDTREEIVDYILMLGNEHSEMAEKALLEMGEDVVPALIAALDIEDWRLRIKAVSIIEKLGEQASSASSALISALADGNLGVVHIAKTALLKIGVKALPDLIKALTTENTYITVPTREILIQMGSKSIAPLIEALEDQRVWFEVERIMTAIGAEAETALIIALRNQTYNAKIRSGIAWILGEIGLPLNAERKDALSKAIREDPDQHVREIAAQAFQELQNKE